MNDVKQLRLEEHLATANQIEGLYLATWDRIYYGKVIKVFSSWIKYKFYTLLGFIYDMVNSYTCKLFIYQKILWIRMSWENKIKKQQFAK